MAQPNWLGFVFTDPACSHPEFADIELIAARTALAEALVHIEHMLQIIESATKDDLKAFGPKAMKLRGLAVSLLDDMNCAF